MSSTKKGKAYEAFVKLALDDLKNGNDIIGQVFWDHKPAGMTIDTDFCIGSDGNNPKIILQITHSGSAKNSDMKAWRNTGELVESKVALKSQPHCYSILFDSIVKEALKKSQAASFDGQLIVGDKKYGSKIQKWIEKNLYTFPTEKNNKVIHLQSLRKTDKVLAKLHSQFKTDLKVLLKKTQPELDSLWTLEKKRLKAMAPKAKDTFIRRGLSKLLIFEDLDVALRLYNGKPVKASELGTYAFDLRLARKFSTIARPLDNEIQNTVNILHENTIRNIIAKAPKARMEVWVQTLRQLPHIGFMAIYVANEYKYLVVPSKLEKRLRDLHANPNALVSNHTPPTGWPPDTLWLVEFLIELIKHHSKVANGYGYAQLAKDVIAKGFGSNSDLQNASQFGGGFGFSAWIDRNPKSGFRDDLIPGVAEVLAEKLSLINSLNIIPSTKKITEQVANNTIQAKLCCYKMFEPLRDCIESVEPRVKKESIRSCFGERARLGGQATKTTLVKSQNTLINWQSAYSGSDSKKKELCGRAVALRYTWNDTKKAFIERPGVKKLILVVDGTWSQSDLDALVRSGWDEIFYPDEIYKLKSTIV